MKNYVFLFFCNFLIVNVLSSLPSPESSNKQALTMLLSQLVSMQTVTCDKEANAEALKWVEKQLKPLGLHSEMFQFNGYSSLVLTTQVTKNPHLWLVAHMDVVAASPSLFCPKISEARIYGRGTYDMKMAIACYIQLMRELKDTFHKYDIGIMLTSDEEIGGMNGVRCLLDKGYGGLVAFLPDGGFNWNFEEEAKGVLHAKVHSHGKTAHGSRPWLGKNAIDQLFAALQDIRSYFENQKVIGSEYFPTVNVGTIQGGKSVNQVPDYAEAQLDIRFPLPMTSERILIDLKREVGKYSHIRIEPLISAAPHKEDLTQHYFQSFRSHAKELHKIEVGSMCAHGSSDARFFSEKNIPVVMIAPAGGEIHSENEWVDLDDLVRFYEVMKKWVMDLSRV